MVDLLGFGNRRQTKNHQDEICGIRSQIFIGAGTHAHRLFDFITNRRRLIDLLL